MATSESYDFNLDRDGIIGEAYQLIGGIAVGESPIAAELTAGGVQLNLMLKGWQTEGIALWLNQKVTLFLGKDTQSYSLGPTGAHMTAASVKTEMKVAGVATDSTIDVDSITGITDADNIGIELDDGTVQWTTINGAPSGDTITLTAALTGATAVDNHVYTYTTKAQRPLEIIEGRRIGPSGISTPLLPISRAEYMALSDKSSSGIVTQMYYDPQLTNGALHVWPTCKDVQDTLELTIKRPFQDFDASANDGDFPVEWLDAVVLNLAIRLGIKLGTPADKDLRDLAKESKFMAKTFDVEKTSTYLQPALR